tara:strand:+ start:539 stop:928 length:390 start_codon:yes stop_codon:yes gene_type:complete
MNEETYPNVDNCGFFQLKCPTRRESYSFKLEQDIDHDNTGKWVVLGSRSQIGVAYKKVRELVKSNEIYGVKMMKKKKAKGKYFLLVYADALTKESTLEKLACLSIKPRHWQSNRLRTSRGELGKISLAF